METKPALLVELDAPEVINTLQRLGFEVTTAAQTAALELLAAGVEVLVVSGRRESLALAERALDLEWARQVVVWGELTPALQGSADRIGVQIASSLSALEVILRGDAESLESWRRTHAAEIVGDSEAILRVLEQTRRAAGSRCSVLVRGETGTGKELFARAIHSGSDRTGGPFVAVNCAALPENLVEDHLFGHVAGAYTGAAGVREGLLVAAHGGTLFLDEVGELPLPAQAKLLRALEEKRVRPVGGDKERVVDVRIVAATHRDLRVLVEEGGFRADLYYRLQVFELALPPLRARNGDLRALAQHFLDRLRQQRNEGPRRLSALALERLEKHLWPGNVRELAHVVERAALLTSTPVVQASALLLPERKDVAPEVVEEGLDLKAALNRTERALISRALEQAQGNRSMAATLLGLNRTTLLEKLKRAEG